MARVKGGTVSKTRRRKVLKQAKGYFGSKHRLYKTAQEQVFHSGAYAYRDRRAKKRDFRKDVYKRQVYALSEGYSDMRDIYDRVKEGEEKSVLALNMFVKRIVEYIAKYYFELEGCDAIVFTAGVGENGAYERRKIVEKLEFLGVKLDREFNEKIASYHDIHEGRITLEDSTIPVYVIPTNEEVMIARDTYKLTEK